MNNSNTEHDHTELRKTWQAGQRWETRVTYPVDCEHWVMVSERGYAEPLWDKYQEYRQVV